MVRQDGSQTVSRTVREVIREPSLYHGRAMATWLANLTRNQGLAVETSRALRDKFGEVFFQCNVS